MKLFLYKLKVKLSVTFDILFRNRNWMCISINDENLEKAMEGEKYKVYISHVGLAEFEREELMRHFSYKYEEDIILDRAKYQALYYPEDIQGAQ